MGCVGCAARRATLPGREPRGSSGAIAAAIGGATKKPTIAKTIRNIPIQRATRSRRPRRRGAVSAHLGGMSAPVPPPAPKSRARMIPALVLLAVAVAGAIGFVGLVIPHLLRPFCGGRPSRLLPASALGGAAMLLASDIAVRIIAPDQDLKLGVLTALVGAPFFLHLLWRMRGVEA